MQYITGGDILRASHFDDMSHQRGQFGRDGGGPIGLLFFLASGATTQHYTAVLYGPRVRAQPLLRQNDNPAEQTYCSTLPSSLRHTSIAVDLSCTIQWILCTCMSNSSTDDIIQYVRA